MAETRWAVYVWDDAPYGGLPAPGGSARFGAIPPGGCYVSEEDGSMLGGHVEFGSRAEAESFARLLNRASGRRGAEFAVTAMD